MDTILVIDDNDAMRDTLGIYLSEIDAQIVMAKGGMAGLEMLEKANPDLVITDLKMPDCNGLDVLNKVKEYDKNIPIIVITAFDDIESTIKAMQCNAYDFIKKPLELDRFIITVKRAIESKKLSERMSVCMTEDFSQHKMENYLVGNSPSMHELYKKIGKVSSNRVSILIQGESGTGKELVSKVIHYAGITKDFPFVAINCTALTETLLESELFGHVKGAFTGAIRDKKGKFELAQEGTIFLDEISEISPSLQVKLLRVLQEKEFERVGGEKTIPMKARIIAATNKDLTRLVEEKRFRTDLYFRLKVFTIDLPALRDRKEDIPSLVVHFLNKINRDLHKSVKKIPYEVMEALENHQWVGNVRELENVLLQAVVLSKGDVLEIENILLPEKHNGNNNFYGTENLSLLSLAEMEERHIKFILDSVNWNKQKACNVLKISKPTLNNKIQAYCLRAK